MIRSFTVGIAGICILIAVSGCAPEPGPGEDSSGGPLVALNEDWSSWGDEGVQLEGETSETLPRDEGILDGRQPVDVAKNQELPADFPADVVPVPEDAQIDDAGSRGSGQWFAVFTQPSLAEADAFVQAIVDAGGFVELDRSQNDDGGFSSNHESDGAFLSALTFEGEGDAFANLEIALK